MTALFAIVVVGLGSYLLRAVFIITLARKQITEVLVVALQFVGPAVLSALVVALLIDDQGRVAMGLPEMAAFLAGGVVAHRTRNHIYTLVAGMSVFWLVGLLI